MPVHSSDDPSDTRAHRTKVSSCRHGWLWFFMAVADILEGTFTEDSSSQEVQRSAKRLVRGCEILLPALA